MHLTDVLHEHGCAVDDLHRDIVEVLDARGCRIGADGILRGAELCGAGRKRQVLRVDRVDDVQRGQPLGKQLVMDRGSTMIWRYLPPAGVGRVMPGIGASCWRIR